MRIQDRYATAIHSSCLTVDERTSFSDTDVLGAFGIAAKTHPLAVELERLFSGDNNASESVVSVLSVMVRQKANGMRLKMAETQADDMARACLAWHRDGVCKPCGGHGKLLIVGTKTHGERDCQVCKGAGKRAFDREFHESMRALAGWLVSEMEREQAKAGPAAMRAIAPSLDW